MANEQPLTRVSRSKAHQHGWDCFRTSGGYTNAFEQDRTLAERIETVYKTAYATGYKNGRADAHQEAIENWGKSPREL